MKAHLEQMLQPALVALCRARPEDPVTWLAEYLLAHKLPSASSVTSRNPPGAATDGATTGPVHPLEGADIVSFVLSHVGDRRTMLSSACVAKPWAAAFCEIVESRAPAVFAAGNGAEVGDDGCRISVNEDWDVDDSDEEEEEEEEEAKKGAAAEAAAERAAAKAEGYEDSVALIGRWLEPDETAHITLIKPHGARQAFTAQPMVGLIAAPKLTSEKKKKTSRDWLLSYTTGFDEEARNLPEIDGRLSRQAECPGFEEEDLDEDGEVPHSWDTLTVSLHRGHVTISLTEEGIPQMYRGEDDEEEEGVSRRRRRRPPRPICERGPPPTGVRSLTVALPADVGRVAFAVEVNANTRYCPSGVDVRVAAGHVDAPRALVRMLGDAAKVRAMEEARADSMAAWEAALRRLKAAQAEQAAETVAKLEDSDADVRRDAVLTFMTGSSRHDGVSMTALLAELPSCVAAVVAKLEDSDEGVRWAAVSTLESLEPATLLAPHVAAVLAKFEHSDEGVRLAAVKTLCRLEQRLSEERERGDLNPATLLAPHAAAMVAKLEDSDGDVREAAVEALGHLEPAALAPYAAAVVAKLDDPFEGWADHYSVRWAAVETLGHLEPAALAEHAAAVASKIEHSDGDVREAAVETLGHLEPAALAPYAAAVFAKLEDSDGDVRKAAVGTLGHLEPATLAEHATAVLAKLEHSDEDVRKAATEMLGRLEPATLAPHAAAVIAKLEDSDGYVRKAAVVTLGCLETATLAEHATAVLATLEDPFMKHGEFPSWRSSYPVRDAAVKTLSKLIDAGMLTEEQEERVRSKHKAY